MSIVGNMAGCYSPLGKSFIFVDENNNEIPGVVVDQEEVFTARAKDVRIGKKFASEEGVMEGENTITYRTSTGLELIFPGDNFNITTLTSYDTYNYTELQCIISKFNTNRADSVYTDKIVIDNYVYNVNSIVQISEITKDYTNKAINLNIVNDTSDTYIIRYITYKEEE